MRRLALALAMALAPGFVPGVARAVHIEARLSAERVEPGTSVALEIRVADPSGSVGQPELTLPDGLQMLGRSQSQNFQWINGRSLNEVRFRIEIEALDPGRYVVGPVKIAVGQQIYLSDALSLVVAAAQSLGGRGGAGPAALTLTLDPPNPYAGQLCRLTVRLIQRATLAEDSQYDPPATPGFWTEAWSEPGGYEARENGRKVQVVERAIRLYPLAPGDGAISRARAVVTPANSSMDPWLGGLVTAGQRVRVASGEVPVHVRALPGGAPPGYTGGVGTFEVQWGSDRSHTAEDQPVTVFLDVRGVGNLPLIKPPVLAGKGFEVFASHAQDSLPPPGAISPGRKRFEWTILPRGTVSLSVSPPDFAWFDPAAGQYRVASAPPLELHIEKSGLPSHDDTGGFPSVFALHPPAPARHGPAPWAHALAGAAAAGAWVVFRRRREPAADAPERARQREWMRAVSRATGPDFWRAADEAVGWAEGRGSRVLRLREEIAAARFGGSSMPEQDVRRRVIERLIEALPADPSASGPPWLAIALALTVLAFVGLVFGQGTLPDARWGARARAADATARAGRNDAAATEWRALWRETHHPDIAARLAWVELGAGHVGPAAAWVLAGDTRDARRASVRWVAGRVREAGGLTGERGRALPFTRREWGWAAFALAGSAGVLWPRRRAALAVATMALIAALAPTLESIRLAWPPMRVVAVEAAFADSSLTLDPGQVVTQVRRDGDRVRVRAGGRLEGDVAADVLLEPGVVR